MKKMYLPILLLLAILGLLSIQYMSPTGIGVSPDSVDYLSLARSLAAGDGYQVGYRPAHQIEAKAHFPPLFPGLIAGLARMTHQDAWPAAGGLNSVLFGVNIFLAGYLVGRITNNILLAWVIALLVLCSTDMLMVHAMAWSEPIFLTLMLTGLYLLARFLEKSTMSSLVAAAVVCGIAMLARYAAVTLLMTGVFVLFFHRGPSLKRRIMGVFVFGGIGSLPMLAWLIQNMSSSGSATNRSFAFHPITFGALEEGVSTVSKWLIPDFLDTRIRIVLFVILLGLLVFGAWKTRLIAALKTRLDETPFARVLFHYGWIYPAFLVVYISFFSVGTYFNFRMMLPLLLCVLILLPLLFAQARTLPWFRVLLLILLASYPVRAGIKIVDTHARGGRGYAAKIWQEGATMNWVRTREGPEILLSNGWDPIYIITGKIAGRLPRKIIYAHGTPNPKYAEEWQAMEDALRPAGGYIILFDDLRWRKFMAEEEELKQRLHLEEHAVFDDGIVYSFPKPVGSE